MRRRLTGLLLAPLVSVLLVLLVANCRRVSTEDQPISARATTDARTEPGHGVRGRVTTADGAPISTTMVQAESLDAPKQAIPELAVMTGKDGSYWWPLKPGHYRLSVAADGYPRVSREVIVRPGEVARLDFILKKASP